MERNYDELNKVCETLNAEEQKEYERSCIRIASLQKGRTICKWIKIISIPLCLLGIGVITFFIAKKISEKLLEKEMYIKGGFEWYQKLITEKKYLEQVYYKLVGLSFTDGVYEQTLIQDELIAAKLMLPESVEYSGGVKGVFDNISFSENHVKMCRTKLDGTSKVIFDGTVIQFKNPKPCLQPVYVSKMLESLLTRDYIDRIMVDNIDFRNDISVESKDKMSAFKILTPQYMEHLYPCIKKYGMISQIVYGKENILVFVPGRHVKYQYTPSHPFTVEQCEENIKETNDKLKSLVCDIYKVVVESMR